MILLLLTLALAHSDTCTEVNSKAKNFNQLRTQFKKELCTSVKPEAKDLYKPAKEAANQIAPKFQEPRWNSEQWKKLTDRPSEYPKELRNPVTGQIGNL